MTLLLPQLAGPPRQPLPFLPIILLFLCIHLWLPSNAQQVDEIIGSYTGQNAEGYLQPLSDSFTSTLNSGFIHKTSIDSGFHVYIGATAYGAFILGDKLKYFTGTTERYFSPQQTATVSTILGPQENVSLVGDKSTSYTFPAGLGVTYFTLAVPQLTIGNIYGTEFYARFIALNPGEEFGKLQLFGGGFRHDLSRYIIPDSPFLLSVQYCYQQFQGGNYVDLTTHKAGLFAGQQFKIFNYYAYAGYQNGKMQIHYEGSEDASPVQVDLTNKNPLLLSLGMGVKLSVIRFDVQASLISPVVVAGSFGLNF